MTDIKADNCSICLHPPREPVLRTNCYHRFCSQCICQLLLETNFGTAVVCPNCRTTIKQLKMHRPMRGNNNNNNSDDIEDDKKFTAFQLKYKGIKLKINIDIDHKHDTILMQISKLLLLSMKRMKLIHKGKLCTEEDIRNNLTIVEIENQNQNLNTRIKQRKKKANSIEYIVIGSKEKEFNLFQTKVNKEYNVRLNQFRYHLYFSRAYIVSFWRSLRLMSFGDIMETIVAFLIGVVQMIILFFKSMVNPNLANANAHPNANANAM